MRIVEVGLHAPLAKASPSLRRQNIVTADKKKAAKMVAFVKLGQTISRSVELENDLSCVVIGTNRSRPGWCGCRDTQSFCRLAERTDFIGIVLIIWQYFLQAGN